MEDESVVHGQLVPSQETDSDNESVTSRLSLVESSPGSNRDASSDACRDVVIDLDEHFDADADTPHGRADADGDAETALDGRSIASSNLSVDEGVEMADDDTASRRPMDDHVDAAKNVFRTILCDGDDEDGMEAHVFETALPAADAGSEQDAVCFTAPPPAQPDAEEHKVLNTDTTDAGPARRQERYVSADVVDVGDVHFDLSLLPETPPPADADADGDVRPGSIGHLLRLVRALAHNLPAGGAEANAANAGVNAGGSAGVGRVNLGFEDVEPLGGAAGDVDSEDSSNEDIDWSWIADEAQLCSGGAASAASAASRPASWLRASMRRVRRFALGEPQPRVASAPESLLPPPLQATIVPARQSAPPSAPAAPAAAAPGDAASRLAPLQPPLDVDAYLAGDASAPPASPALSASPAAAAARGVEPEDFPRRYSMLGRLDSGAPLPPDVSAVEAPSDPATEDDSASDCDSSDEKEDRWPHSLSSLLSGLGCTLGLFNVSRFAVLSVHFGANFVIQFLALSAAVGWPLYVLHASLGQHLKAGAVDMWRVSPLFQGIGIALLLAQAMLGLYSVVGVAWLFTYFRDSFINKYDAYRWAENGTRLEESVSEYLNVVVLQRQGNGDSSPVGHLKFQVTFNLAVVWMIVFVCLSKGIKSYGKSVYLFGIVPVLGIAMLTIKMLSITDVWFDHTAWSELFVNTNCWAAAAIECFTTWGLLGAATMQMRSHAGSCRLPREVLAVGLVTLATLVSAALLANGFSQLLRANELRYVPSSFESEHNTFLMSADGPRLSSTPTRWMSHGHFVVGVQVVVPGSSGDLVSGYQVAPFATELAPAVFARLGAQAVSPFWTVLFYFTLILLGISQQLCIWHCVITGIMAINIERLRSWETTITFLSCACGFVLGLPMTTELGVWVVYFMDFCVGGAWWLVLLHVALVVAALMALGGEQVAQTLLGSRRSLAQAVVVFTWNVVLPVSLTVTSVAWFKANGYRELYASRHHGYWPAWARRVGCLLQLLPLIIVPFVSAIQTWRYLTAGPPDLFDRLRLLCRPGSAGATGAAAAANAISAPSQALPELAPLDDPPPKYTPPPSYATATGARIAKLLRRSFRRLVGPSAPSPPDYSAVLVEMGGAPGGGAPGGVATLGRRPPGSTLSALEVAHILRSSMRRTLRREQARSTPPAATLSSKAAPVI